MTLKDKEAIQRALGIIEGVACGVSERAADMLYTAVELIDSVLAVAENAMTTATGSKTERVHEEG